MAVLVMAAVPASAHECLNSSRVERANTAIAAHSHGWFDIQTSQLLAIFVVECIAQPGPDCPPPPPGLTAADVTYIQTTSFDQLIGEIFGFATSPTIEAVLTFTGEIADVAAGCGVPTHYLTLNNATAAGGAPGKVTTNGKGIDHFPDMYGEQLMAAFVEVLFGVPAC